MQSLVFLAAKLVADTHSVERVFDLPVELRDRVQVHFDKSTQLEYFNSWIFEWEYRVARHLVKVTYQDAYMNIVVYRNSNFGAEFNLYAGQLHGLNRIIYESGACERYVYKLGKLISSTVFHSDGSPYCAREYIRAYHEIISFEPGGNGVIREYAYYSRDKQSYIALIIGGNNIPARVANTNVPLLKKIDWVLLLMDACGIYMKI
jgi:hypothetical protein